MNEEIKIEILPLIVFILILTLIFTGNVAGGSDYPNLLLVLNTIFLTLIPLYVSYISIKSYFLGKQRSMFFLGLGMFAIAIFSFLAGIVRGMPDGANLTLSFHNTGVFLGSILILISSIISFRDLKKNPTKKEVIISYLLLIIVLSLISFLIFTGIMPKFFILGQGATLLRQAVLGSAILLFLISSCIFYYIYRKNKSEILLWYIGGLVLLFVGLFAIFFQKSVGSPIGWIGRVSQYLGGIYFLISILKSRGIKEIE